MIWEPFVLAIVLGLVVSAGLYFAYLWPAIEPADMDDPVATDSNVQHASPSSSARGAARADGSSVTP